MTQPHLPKNAGPVHWVGPEDCSASAGGLIHCFRLPKEATLAQPAPVVVMIHGRGGDESVMWIFKQAIPPGAAVITPRAPVARDKGGYSWFWHTGAEQIQPEPDSLGAAVERLYGFLSDLPQHYPVDPERLVLIGFSQGATMSNTLVITRPGVVLGVASLAGLTPDLVARTAANGSLAGFPVFIAHGTRDNTVPIAAARLTRDLYTRLGAQVTYGEYPTGHKMTAQASGDLKHWLADVLLSR